MTFLNRQNYNDKEEISGCQRLWVGRGCDYKDIREVLGDDGIILYLDCGHGT